MPIIKESECVGCVVCADVCPENAIIVGDVAVIDELTCVQCGRCADECPFSAILSSY